jgi:hypothetical protein
LKAVGLCGSRSYKIAYSFEFGGDVSDAIISGLWTMLFLGDNERKLCMGIRILPPHDSVVVMDGWPLRIWNLPLNPAQLA